MLSKEISSTIFWDFLVTRPGIETRSARLFAKGRYIYSKVKIPFWSVRCRLTQSGCWLLCSHLWLIYICPRWPQTEKNTTAQINFIRSDRYLTMRTIGDELTLVNWLWVRIVNRKNKRKEFKRVLLWTTR